MGINNMTMKLQRGNGQSVSFEEGISDLDYKIQEMRVDRNMLLAETDWWATSDNIMTQKQKDYRQALKDLPSTSSPELDENGKLTGVTWPTKPE